MCIDPDTFVWAVERIDDRTLIGSVTLRNLTDPARRGELGVLIGVPGSGYGSDAVRTVLAHAFTHLGLQCVSLEVRGDNRRAITAYMRAGFRPEGILRRRLLKAGELHDLYAMSILREEFEASTHDF
jgi:RimJ/RimL family protein N-acetyltransferase